MMHLETDIIFISIGLFEGFHGRIWSYEIMNNLVSAIYN
jgi:hypothetical protein